MSVIRLRDFDEGLLRYSGRNTNAKHNLDSYYISYEADGRWPRVQFPWMRHPFDTLNDKFARGDGAKDMLLSFDPEDSVHRECMDKLRAIDTVIRERVRIGGWVKPGQPLDWYPSLKEKDGKFFNIKFKLPRIGENRDYATTVVDATTGLEVSMEEGLKQGCRAQVIGRPARVYVRKGQVGVIWEATIVRTKPDPSIKPVEFVEDST